MDGAPEASADAENDDDTPQGQLVPKAVVALGASAGGLEALREFLASLPGDTGAAYVVIQHLDPTHESQLVPLLARSTSMPAEPIGDGVRVRPDHLYVIAPNTDAVLDGEIFRTTAPGQPRGQRLPIDLFLRSLARSWGAQAIAVILSGNGLDGTQGLHEIKQAGGMALVQLPSTAAYDGMPRSAAESGAADFVLPIAEMPEAVLRYLHHAYAGGAQAGETDREGLARVLDSVQQVMGHDLHTYRENTLRRRIHRRMGMHGVADLDAYEALLREDRTEVSQLFGDLLIGVTAFFREPEVFDALAGDVVPDILGRKSEGEPIRAWIPGCSTGEEAYSIAMLLIEQVSASGKGCPVQVFATDVDEVALDTARCGQYPADRVAALSDARRQRFFNKERSLYRASKDLREVVVFAPQNLLSDPPFSQMDLVSCRNLLIYLKPEVQRKVISLFHFALVPQGHLVLGSAETLGSRHPLFEPVSEAHRIYRRNPLPSRPPLELPVDTARTARPHRVTKPEPTGLRGSARHLVERTLLADFAPAAALIDENGDVLYLSGPTDTFLALQPGEPTANLLELARRGLRGPIRSALRAAARDRAASSEQLAQVKIDDCYREVLVRVKPLRDGAGLLCLVTFEAPSTLAPTAAKPPTDESVVQQLEAELEATRDDLQSTIEEVESANEELRASNEEVLSMNEELQSTNEELETSKEELQSLNEELSTLNAQIQEKLDELARANDDIENLLASTDMATLFLDRELRIQRFTAATRELFNVIPTDIGRAITDITPRYADTDLADRARQVLQTLVPEETEVRGPQGHWYSRRILPYRTAEDQIRGVVVTYAEISAQKRAEETVRRAKDELEERVSTRTAELAQAVARLQSEVLERGRAQRALTAERDHIDSILATAADGILTIDEHGKVDKCNKAAERMFGYQAGELIGRNVSMLMPEPDRGRHDGYIKRYVDTGQARIIGIGREVTARRKDGTLFPVDLAIGEIRNATGRRFTGFLRDMTERRQLEEQVRQTQKMEAVGRLASGIAHDFNNLLMGITGCANVGLSKVEEGGTANRYLEEIREAAMSGASITRHLLSFARKREETLEVIDLNKAVTRTQTLLERLLGEDVSLRVDLAEQHPWVRWDAGQLEQVLMNLAVNARDAMPGGGQLAIKVRTITPSTEGGAADGEVYRHAHIMLSVHDSGTGIPEEVRAHIFEPFFTTKDPGTGTGLGLSTVYALVKKAGGDIQIDSKMGAGTTFEIALPLASSPEEEKVAPATPPGGQETLLVVEDEPMVRNAMRHYLEQKGYDVLDAKDGKEALELCRSLARPISLLITDVVLRGAPGPEVAREVAELCGCTPTLYVSAHPRELLGERLPADVELLQKPFDEDELTGRVRDMLDRAAPGDGPAVAPAGRPTVLLVEDNRAARTASSELIEDMGYDVLEAESGTQALERVRELGSPPDILILDLGLPDMRGDALAETLASNGQPRCVVYISGRSEDDPTVQRLLGDPHTYFVQKPWEPAALEDVLREGLASAT